MICKDCERESYCQYPCAEYAEEINKCPDCGNKLIPDSGCSFCPACGYSPCK